MIDSQSTNTPLKSEDSDNMSAEGGIKNQLIGGGDGVFISTYGCQMNVHDSERMLSLLEMMNFRAVPTPEEASLIIVNSCSIREKPVHKVHSEIGRYKRLKEKNPAMRIGVGGCVAQQEKEKLLKDIPLLDFVFGTDAIDQLPSIVAKARSGGAKVNSTRFEHSQPYHIETMVRNPGVSTFVNITKGCDNFCTFCVVPFTRGRERSRPLSQVVSDVNNLVKRGVKEVTLLGQNVNSYESECGANFAKIMKTIAVDTGIERIRFTTPHPKDFDEEVMDVMREHGDKIMEYVHLPVQAGNSQVLERMNRGYSREQYLEKVKMIFDRLPNAVLSTDIIVGFPGETAEQFEETMTLLDAVPYESIFAFQYSPRPFTKAAKYTDQVPEPEKNQRLIRLLAKHREIAFKLAKKYEGQTFDVLVEELQASSGLLRGRSRQNKVVHFNGGAELIGSTIPVRINEAAPLTFHGERVLN
jgi:tRNA-2-methylthio-N6-dimethylallyladenosine synthase